ncbi:MAG TPA: hypothetical protein VFI25_03610 [Planctomycetota bacterium]|jgi:2',3'-cyclic-nucleotide 2'-phosphodiesterase (5'-nucleotidase family)|nr:hypothetical protein [Planctomycetota bacterium]
MRLAVPILLGWLGPAAFGQPNVTILHTNDLHGHVIPWGNGAGERGGIARIAGIANAIRTANAGAGIGTLLLDAGDQREGSLFYDVDRGRSLWQMMEVAGYDAIQVGNHDHLFGVQALYDDLAAAFPGFSQNARFLWGNVNPLSLDSTGTLPQLPVSTAAIAAFESCFADVAGTVDPALLDAPFANSKVFNQTLMFQVGAVRVGIFGLDTDEVLYTQTVDRPTFGGDPADGEHLTFYDPVAHPYAAAMVAYLDDPDGNAATDDGADLIVAASHLGVGRDLALAAAAVAPNGRTIDLVVGGHSHTRLNTAIPFVHPGGGTTWVVQAGSYGEFLGRVDLLVDPSTNAVALLGASLVEVTPAAPEDPLVALLVSQTKARVDAAFGAPYGSPVGDAETLFVPGLLAPSALGSLAAEAVRWRANEPLLSLGVDFSIEVPFVQRQAIFPGPVTPGHAQEVLPLHDLGTDPVHASTFHAIDLPGGLVNAPNLHDLLLLIPGTNPPDFLGTTRLELFLEAIFSLEDLLAGLGPLLGFAPPEVGPFLNGLGWSGISFVVDPAGPLFERIDPATIAVNGVPWVGNEGASLRFTLDSIVARLVGPFLGGLIPVESPPNSGNLGPLFPYDPVADDPGLPTWTALRDFVAHLGTVGAEFEPDGTLVRSKSPDLTIRPSRFSFFPPAAIAGQPLRLAVPVENLGETAVLGAVAEFRTDPTPLVHGDDPDGFTDAATGAAWPLLASLAIGPVPPHDGNAPGEFPVSFTFSVPAGLPPGEYRIFPRILGVLSADPLRPETVVANNSGPGISGPLVARDLLRVRGVPTLGSVLQVAVEGSPGHCYCVLLASAAGNLPLPGIGTVLVDLGASMPLYFGTLGASGVASLSVPVPPNPALLNAVFFLQGALTDPGIPATALTNRVGPVVIG